MPRSQFDTRAKAPFQTRVTDLRFCKLLGRENWNRLPAAVQARFSQHLNEGESRVYRGYVIKTAYSRIGRILAHILRVIGAPLPIGHSDNMAAVVTVTEDAPDAGQFWSRQYVRAKGFPQIIQSTKRFAGPTGLEEYIGYGIGMSLKIRTENDALYFESHRYFLKIGWQRISIPNWMTPGNLTVIHADHGDGWFEFVLKLEHRILGRLLEQRAMFTDTDDAN